MDVTPLYTVIPNIFHFIKYNEERNDQPFLSILQVLFNKFAPKANRIINIVEQSPLQIAKYPRINSIEIVLVCVCH